jgi:hypothetical protein
MVKSTDFLTGELKLQRYVFTPYVFEDFTGGYFDTHVGMSYSCVIIAVIDNMTVYINNLPSGTGYATDGEIKIIHNIDPVYDVILVHESTLTDGDIITSDGTDFVLSPYCSAMLQYMWDPNRSYRIWKVISCTATASSI